MPAEKKYIVKPLGSLDETNPVIKFAFKLPSYCKVLSSISLFSPELSRVSASQINAELSMWINNQKTPIGNCLFTLGYPALDDQLSRLVDVNQELIKGNELTGYVKYLAGAETFNIHLILECKM